MRFRMPALTALLTAGILALAGCVPAPDVVVPVEPSGAQPVFVSDEEALAAAVAVYEEYQRVAYEVGSGTQEDYERLQPFLTGDWYQKEVAGYEKFAADGLRLSGSASIAGSLLQQWWEDPSGTANVIVYICNDLSDARIVDEEGTDRTPTERQDIIPIQVSFVSSSSMPRTLIISEVLPWSGAGLCS